MHAVRAKRSSAVLNDTNITITDNRGVISSSSVTVAVARPIFVLASALRSGAQQRKNNGIQSRVHRSSQSSQVKVAVGAASFENDRHRLWTTILVIVARAITTKKRS